jgi:hypothetical protein
MAAGEKQDIYELTDRRIDELRTVSGVSALQSHKQFVNSSFRQFVNLVDPMARGWESKAVEAQQDAAAAPRKQGRGVTREEAARQAERATLMLARTRALADLQAACVPAHRAMLEQAVADLDRRLAALEG